MRTTLLLVLLSLSACGGEVVDSKTDSPSTTPSGAQQPAQGPGTTTGGTTSSNVADTPADANDPCSITEPGEAKALPAGITLPSGAVGLRLEFTLENQRVELASIHERGVAPAWTTKDTQIFDPANTSGDWVETRDGAGTLTYQQGVWDPLGRTLEAAPDPNDPNSHWSNSEVCKPTADFNVEIPADGTEVRIYAQELSSRPTKLIAWYRLR